MHFSQDHMSRPGFSPGSRRGVGVRTHAPSHTCVQTGLPWGTVLVLRGYSKVWVSSAHYKWHFLVNVFTSMIPSSSSDFSSLFPHSLVLISHYLMSPITTHTFHLAQTLGCQFLNQDAGLQTDMLAPGSGHLLPEIPGSFFFCGQTPQRWLQPRYSLPTSWLSFLTSEHRTFLSVFAVTWRYLYFFLMCYIINTCWSCRLFHNHEEHETRRRLRKPSTPCCQL